jgi:hypothetical protein
MGPARRNIQGMRNYPDDKPRRTVQIERDVGKIEGEIGQIAARATINGLGETTAELYIPYGWVPAERAGELIRLLQKASEWSLDQRDQLLRERALERARVGPKT